VAAEATQAAAVQEAVGKAMANKVAQEAVNHLVVDLRSTHGENLASVVLYGSAASGERDDSQTDYNLLIALHRITPEDLRQAQAPIREWRRLGHPLPVYFTVNELREAADVFPIEFHQMEKARVVLFGEDPLAGLEISDAHLRHQTEYELRSKLIQLRRLYIPASVSVEKLIDLMTSSLSSFAALFRAVLLLSGIEPPVTNLDAVRATASKLGLNEVPFERIFALRSANAASPDENEANDLFGAYLNEIERVIEAVDHMND
jgi:predicted nucleotidyltransferase